MSISFQTLKLKTSSAFDKCVSLHSRHVN